jgi:hypothetical protein
MDLNLIQILGLTPEPDHTDSNALYYGHVPQLAPFGYLHTIFAPPNKQMLLGAAERLGLPECMQRFLAIQNGADLFFNRLAFYGILQPRNLINRNADRIQTPFDIERPIWRWKVPRDEEWLLIGSYGYDGTGVMVHRGTQRVGVVAPGSSEVRSNWASLADYLRAEILRLSGLFDEAGDLRVESKYTLPGSDPIA